MDVDTEQEMISHDEEPSIIMPETKYQQMQENLPLVSEIS